MPRLVALSAPVIVGALALTGCGVSSSSTSAGKSATCASQVRTWFYGPGGGMVTTLPTVIPAAELTTIPTARGMSQLVSDAGKLLAAIQDARTHTPPACDPTLRARYATELSDLTQAAEAAKSAARAYQRGDVAQAKADEKTVTSLDAKAVALAAEITARAAT